MRPLALILMIVSLCATASASGSDTTILVGKVISHEPGQVADTRVKAMTDSLPAGILSAFTPRVSGVSAPVTAGDTIRPIYQSIEQRWWFNRLKNMTLDLKDTTVIYPRFIKFCVDVYNWGDHFFNPYDPEYVEGTGKRWKARVVNDNWLDSYAMRFPDKMSVSMLSNPYSNLGGYIQYMAVSVGYTYDMGKIFGTAPLNHKKWEFGFNCARFNIDLYYQENEGGTYLRKFGNYKHGRLIKIKFPGVKLKTSGLDAIYFFNNRRYSHGAAYNFSKFQKRSQGSVIAGFSYTNIKLSFDFTQLPEELKPYLTVSEKNYLFHYDSYAAMIGYGYNCVINPHLLYNITVTPSFGASHCYEDSQEGEKWLFSMNISARTSLTYNLGNWFFGLIAKINGHWYKSGTYSLFSSIENFSANIGIRF